MLIPVGNYIKALNGAQSTILEASVLKGMLLMMTELTGIIMLMCDETHYCSANIKIMFSVWHRTYLLLMSISFVRSYCIVY